MRRQLLLLWLAFLLICLVIGAVLYDLYRQSEESRLRSAQDHVRAACESIRATYGEGPASSPAQTAGRDIGIDHLVERALAAYTGIEGGIWDRRSGFVGYAYPTYDAATRKTDVPAAEMPHISRLAAQTAESREVQESHRKGAREMVLTRTCTLSGSHDHAVAWTMTRVAASGPAYTRVSVALSGLLGFAILSGGWLGIALGRRSRSLRRMERALAAYNPDGSAPVPTTGDVELDRIVGSFNGLAERLVASRRESEGLARRVAEAERLAALGRLSAGLAHEIRNPLGAVRLKIENAKARADGGDPALLDFVLGQVARLERLVRRLLAMTQQSELKPEPVALAHWLDEQILAMTPHAEAHGVHLVARAADEVARFDAFHLGRALGNLIDNAVRHAPRQSEVRVSAAHRGPHLVLSVEDDGPGVPVAIRDQLFEPFVTARPDGTGLGLTLTRDIAHAHGGRVSAAECSHGALFEIEIPWQTS